MDQQQIRIDKRLALAIATGLALFLGGNLVLLLPGTTSPDGLNFRTWSSVASWAVRFVGALVVVLCSFRLARRLRSHVAATGGLAWGDRPSPGRRYTSRAFVVVIAGVVLMAAAELPVLLYRVGDASYSSNPFDVVVFAVAAIGMYLGPVMTAAGAYLALRRLEDATAPASRPSNPSSTTPPGE